MKKHYEKYMLVVGCGGTLVFYFQAFKIIQEQSAANVSLAGFVIAFFSVASWMIYGIHTKDRIVFISNALATIGAFMVVVSILVFS